MATIRDIAKRAGVSVATVSRVVNGYPGVHPDTRERVLTLTRELSYRPNAVARSLVTRRSYMIGIFFLDLVNSDLRHPFFQDVLAGFKGRVGQVGYDLLIFNNQRQAEAGLTFAQRCYQQQVDGVLVVGVPRPRADLRELAHSGIPCMGVDCELVGPRAGHFRSDNVGGARTAVEYLIRLGHRKIAFINGDPISRPARDRLQGYREALEAHDLPFSADWVRDSHYTREGGYISMQDLLLQPEAPTAVFCAADIAAIGAMDAARAAGLSVPDDLSIIGFDDIQGASMVTPRLTTVQQNGVTLGELAAEALLSTLGNEGFRPPITVVPTQLVLRESTAPPPGL